MQDRAPAVRSNQAKGKTELYVSSGCNYTANAELNEDTGLVNLVPAAGEAQVCKLKARPQTKTRTKEVPVPSFWMHIASVP